MRNNNHLHRPVCTLQAVSCLALTSCQYHAGRQSADGSQCWTAVSTAAFARGAIDAGLPLQVNGKYQRPEEAAMASVTSGVHRHSRDQRSQPAAHSAGHFGAAGYFSAAAAPTARAHTCTLFDQTDCLAEMLGHVRELLAPFAAGGAAALDAPLHAAAQRWGSALYPVPHRGWETLNPEELLVMTPDGRVAAVGDWLAGSEAQRVVVQAHATARALAERLAE